MPLSNAQNQYPGTFESESCTFDNTNHILTFSGDIKTYRALRRNLKKRGVKLPYFPTRTEKNAFKINLANLASLALWQLYVLADELQLKQGEEFLSEKILADARPKSKRGQELLDQQEAYKKVYILLGVPLNNNVSTIPESLPFDQRNFWQTHCESALRELNTEAIKFQLLQTVTSYIASAKTFTGKRARSLPQLINLIQTTESDDLRQTLGDFFADKARFQTGGLGRSRLKNVVMKEFRKSYKDFLLSKIANHQKQMKPAALKFKLLTAIQTYIHSVKTLSEKRGINCDDLINLIQKNTNPLELYAELNTFFADKTQFRTGLFGRSELKKQVMEVFKLIESAQIHKLPVAEKNSVIALLNDLPIGEKIKRGRSYCVGEHVFVFTHSIEVAESLNKPGKKSYFVLSKKEQGVNDHIIGEGSFGTVKAMLGRFKLEDKQGSPAIRISGSKWVRKKVCPETGREGSFSQDVQTEADGAKACARKLNMHKPVVVGKGTTSKAKFFMEDAGLDLLGLRYLVKNRLWLLPVAANIAKILLDVAQQALEAYEKQFFIMDIKSANIVYDRANNKATIIDHRGSIPIGSSIPSPATPLYLPPEYRISNYNPHDRAEVEKIMVFSIGMSLAEFMVGKKVFGSRLQANTPNPHLCSPNHQALNDYKDNDILKNLVLEMIAMKPEERPTLQEVVARASTIIEAISTPEQPALKGATGF